jgi:hypothetical protein
VDCYDVGPLRGAGSQPVVALRFQPAGVAASRAATLVQIAMTTPIEYPTLRVSAKRVARMTLKGIIALSTRNTSSLNT